MTATSHLHVLHKRDRPASTNDLLKLEAQPANKHREVVVPYALPVLQPDFIGESKASYFKRLADSIDASLFSTAHDFDREGIYLYKRPVRSQCNQAALLAQGGTVFHHCVLYVKQGEELAALEFGPANAMDVTANFFEEAPAGPVLCERPVAPEPECLPMMHIAVEHHPLGAELVQKALRFAQSRPYQALRNNCIAFADFAVRVLTGGAVRSAPLIFDLVIGKVPPQDSPLLGFLFMATQMTWFNVCDGSRLTAAFLREHAPALLPPPGAAGAAPAGAPTSGAPCGQGQQGRQAAIVAVAAAAAAEAEEAAAAAAAEARRPSAAVGVAAAAQGPLGPAGPQRAAQQGAATAAAVAEGLQAPADSGRSEGTAFCGPARLHSVPSMQSTLHSSGSSRNLDSAASGKFNPLGLTLATRAKGGGDV